MLVAAYLHIGEGTDASHEGAEGGNHPACGCLGLLHVRGRSPQASEDICRADGLAELFPPQHTDGHSETARHLQFEAVTTGMNQHTTSKPLAGLGDQLLNNMAFQQRAEALRLGNPLFWRQSPQSGAKPRVDHVNFGVLINRLAWFLCQAGSW